MNLILQALHDIPAAQIERSAGLLRDAGFPVEMRQIPGRHYAPLPDERVDEVWTWLEQQRRQAAPR